MLAQPAAQPLQLGPHTLRSNIALAPMAGLTDVPFRALAWRFGVGFMVSEMVSSKPELWETGKSRLRRVPVAGVHPVAVQIAGTDPVVMAQAAKRHVDDGIEVIDINFGCPAKKVCRKSAGSALLADLDRVARIVDAVANAVPVPVTIKTRTGLVAGDNLGLQAVEIAVRAGAQLAVIHARSRQCRFHGPVDYAAIGRWRQTVTLAVPIFVNGDIRDSASARRALDLSHARWGDAGSCRSRSAMDFHEPAGCPGAAVAGRVRTCSRHA